MSAPTLADRKLADDELLIERLFDAPPSLLFALWSEPAHMKNWFGPNSFVCTFADIDFRVGGAWRVQVTSPISGEKWMGGVYRVIEQDRRIVFSFAWEHQPGVENVVTLQFVADGDKTLQIFHQQPFVSVSERDAHVDGWTAVFDKEQVYAERTARETPR